MEHWLTSQQRHLCCWIYGLLAPCLRRNSDPERRIRLYNHIFEATPVNFKLSGAAFSDPQAQKPYLIFRGCFVHCTVPSLKVLLRCGASRETSLRQNGTDWGYSILIDITMSIVYLLSTSHFSLCIDSIDAFHPCRCVLIFVNAVNHF
jgi:hypothetical protein